MTVAEAHKNMDYSNITTIYRRQFCHDCKIVYYHARVFCQKCPKKVNELKISNFDLVKEYGNYKDGN